MDMEKVKRQSLGSPEYVGGYRDGWEDGREDALTLWADALTLWADALTLCARCTPERDHNGVLCRTCANRALATATAENERLREEVEVYREYHEAREAYARDGHTTAAMSRITLAQDVIAALAEGAKG